MFAADLARACVFRQRTSTWGRCAARSWPSCVPTIRVGNALKYGPSDAPVKARIDGFATDQIVVSVQNGGPPIPEATRESLFEPLVRGANTEREGYNLGLGLYIVREIALAHGGSASVESDARVGTVFTVRLPRDAGSAEAAFPGLRMN